MPLLSLAPMVAEARPEVAGRLSKLRSPLHIIRFLLCTVRQGQFESPPLALSSETKLPDLTGGQRGDLQDYLVTCFVSIEGKTRSPSLSQEIPLHSHFSYVQITSSIGWVSLTPWAPPLSRGSNPGSSPRFPTNLTAPGYLFLRQLLTAPPL